MKPRPTLPSVALVAALLGVICIHAAPPPSKSVNLNDLSLEIAALQTLHDLELIPDQLAALGKLGHDSSAKNDDRQPAKTSSEFAAALSSLHAAYVRGDDNQIGECQEKLDALMEKQEPELDNGVAITEGGRSNAADALKLLNVRQIGSFLAMQEITDPGELLVSAQEQVREIKNAKDLENEIATVAEEVAFLVNGDDDEAAQKTKDKVTKLLQGAAKKRSDRKALEKAARELVGEVDYKDVLGHILEHGMAELLSNPRLDAAIRIQTRVASRPAPKKAPTPAPAKKPPKS
jgi:hypothetical protein